MSKSSRKWIPRNNGNGHREPKENGPKRPPKTQRMRQRNGTRWREIQEKEE